MPPGEMDTCCIGKVVLDKDVREFGQKKSNSCEGMMTISIDKCEVL